METRMSVRATDFAASWVAENINPEAYDPGSQIIENYVEQLTAAAEAEGIDENELIEGVGDLSDFISEAMEAATDDEVERLASRDD
jgi:hypothetical protein